MRDWLAETAASKPDAVALRLSYFAHMGSHYAVYSYARLNQIAARLALRLAAAGVGNGDHVGLLVDHAHRAVETIHALIRLRAILVPLNTRLTSEEVGYLIKTAGCKVVLCDAPNEEKALEAAGDARVYNVNPTPRSTVGGLPDDEYFAGGVGDYLVTDIDLDAVQSIIFTSGTTGRPKGAQITYGNLYASARASAKRLGVEREDRWLLSLPLYHVGGLSVVIRSCLYGTTVVIPPPTREPEDLMRVIDAESVTMISLVPTQLYRLLESGFMGSPTLRLILLGGAAASPDLLRRCCALGLPVATTYGLTEAASQVTTMVPADVCRKPGSVGKPIGDTTVRIEDEAGHTLSAGEIGEVVVSGKTVMAGYLDLPPVESQIGFRTGDLGYLDADGDLWLVQRRSDLIVSGGENIYPSEVEGVLRAHPDVIDACVVGLPDEEWGQRAAAMVVRREDSNLSEADLLAYSRDRLAGYKQPRVILFAQELPQTASGKIRRPDVIEALLKASLKA